MTIDPTAYTPAYVQLAAIIREHITSGRIPPGTSIPSEIDLIQEYRVGRDTVRLAIATLRSEGIIRTEHGRGSFVADDEPEPVEVSGPAGVSARMPSPAERQRLNIPEGVPVIVVSRQGGEDALYPAHRYELEIGPSSGHQ